MVRDYIKEINETTELSVLFDIMSDISKDIRNLYNNGEILGDLKTLAEAHKLATAKAESMMPSKKAE